MSTHTYYSRFILRLVLFALTAGQQFTSLAQVNGIGGKVKKPNVTNAVKNTTKTPSQQGSAPGKTPGGGNGNSGAGKDSGLVESDKFFVANGIDGEFKTAEEACKAFGKVKFPGYQLVKCTTALNGSVYYKFVKGNQTAEQQGQVWFKIRCPEYAYQTSMDGTDNWQKQECKCFTGYHPEGKKCIKDTVKTCLGELIEKYGSHKETLLRLSKESILWDSVCSLLRASKIEVEKFLTAAEKKTSKQDTNLLLWKNFKHIDTGILISWQVVNKATAKKQSTGLINDYPLVSAVHVIKYGGEYKGIGGDEGMMKLIEANQRANCKSCDKTGVPFLSPIDEYLFDVEYFVATFANQEVLASAKQTNGNGSYNKTVEGTAFQFRILHNYQNAVIGDSAVFEGSIDDADNEGDNEERSLCKFDIRSGFNANYHFYEFKSLAPSSHFNEKQLLTYLKNIRNYNDLTYIFDGKKITQEKAVKLIMNTIQANFEDWFAQMPPEKWGDIFATSPDKEDIKAAIANPENLFYYRVVKVYP